MEGFCTELTRQDLIDILEGRTTEQERLAEKLVAKEKRDKEYILGWLNHHLDEAQRGLKFVEQEINNLDCGFDIKNKYAELKELLEKEIKNKSN